MAVVDTTARPEETHDEQARFVADLTDLVAGVYSNHAGLAERTDELARRALAAGQPRFAALAGLIRAELDNRNGRAAEGISAAQSCLVTSTDAVVRAHAHAVLAGGLWRLGDKAEAVQHAYEAVHGQGDETPLCLQVDHAIILAVQVNDHRVGGSSLHEFPLVAELAERLGDDRLVVANLNNWAWLSHVAGNQDEALLRVREMRARNERTGRPLNASCADTVARILMEAGDLAEAERVIDAALRDAPPTDSDGLPACLLTRAELQAHAGDLDGALRTLRECRRITVRDQVTHIDADALRTLADVHAARGDYRAAYEHMILFHDVWQQHRSEQSEALAAITKARYAVDEAQRSSDQYRELSERDPLTGLWNRRRVDAYLAARLAVPPAERPPACLAMLDLDHFKQVNDTFSHEIGDVVLRCVADLLRTMLDSRGCAGRLGGEEFVAVIDADLEQAKELCEAVRVAVAAYDWPGVAPGLSVTTSVGVTQLTDSDDYTTWLRRADLLLYDAKHSGRNRVCG